MCKSGMNYAEMFISSVEKKKKLRTVKRTNILLKDDGALIRMQYLKSCIKLKVSIIHISKSIKCQNFRNSG